MIQFKALIEQFGDKGEKTGWTYIEVPLDVAEKIKPNYKRAFRVKGKLDNYAFHGVSLVPMGEGNFIMALNAAIRKGIQKQKGEFVIVQIAEDTYEKPFDEDFIACMADEPAAVKFFNTLPKGHQRYFSNWIASAKTDTTKTKRIVQAISALARGLGFSEMSRMNKKNAAN